MGVRIFMTKWQFDPLACGRYHDTGKLGCMFSIWNTPIVCSREREGCEADTKHLAEITTKMLEDAERRVRLRLRLRLRLRPRPKIEVDKARVLTAPPRQQGSVPGGWENARCSRAAGT